MGSSPHVTELPSNVMRLTFLGTGAAGGTPGAGRSRRRESSLLVESGAARLLVDATSQLDEQIEAIATLDAVVLTHAHRDAAGGVPVLDRWCAEHDRGPVRLLGSPQAIALIGARAGLVSLRLSSVEPGRSRRVAGLAVRATEVPHAQLATAVGELCRKAAPAFDGMTVEL